MTLDEAVDLVLAATVTSWGGEVFVPKMHAIRLLDLANAMIEINSPNRPIPVQQIGLRPGEKFYEELITDHEQTRCLETERLLIVLPYLKGVQISAEGQPHATGPDDYPDKPRWTERLFSSKAAQPLGRVAVHQLLEKQRPDRAGRKAP